MQEPWELYGGTAEAAPGGPVVVGTPRPRQAPLRAAQTPEEIEADRLRNIRLGQEIGDAPVSRERAQQQVQQGNTNGVNFTDENSLRNNFAALPEVRRYNEVVPIYIAARDATDTTAGDLNLTYAFGKIMDPGSVVREAEQVMVQGTSPVADRLRALMSEIDRTGRLSAETRANLMTELRTRRLALAQAYAQQRNQYTGLAQRYGFEPASIVGSHPAEPYAAEERLAHGEASPLPRPEGDIGFSGRTIESGTVPIPAQQMQAYNQWMATQRRGQLTVQDYAREYERLTGRPVSNPDEIVRTFNETGRFSPLESVVYQNPDAEQTARELNEVQGEMGLGALTTHGAMLGLGDEAAGVGGMIRNAAASPFTSETLDPAGAYSTYRDADRIRQDEARARYGWGGTAAEVLGGLASGRISPNALAGAPTTLAGRVGRGAQYGAQVGALGGFGYGEGAQDSAVNALIGATGGALLGGGIPLAGAAGRMGVDVARTVAGRNPDLARRTVSRAILDDSNTPRGVGLQMTEAQANGVPMMLADTGDNARGLLAASSRAPGPGRTLARDALDERQAGLGERVTGAIERDLGPVSNPHEVAEGLMTTARTNAAPLYEVFYARPGADTFARRLGRMMGRPAMRQALARARAIAQEEGRDPNTLGFDINEAGETIVSRTPSWQTWDYVKRAIDDVLSSQPRNPATGQIIMDEGTRAIEGTRTAFLRLADGINPAWAPARAAWAGPVQAREAMDLGRRVLNMTADDLTARTARMGPSEQQFLDLGIRRAMAERIANLGDTANVSHALLGTGRKRALMLRRFGGREGFDRFVSTLQQEQAGFQTYRTARQGSPTAANVQDDAALNAASNGVALATDLSTGVPVASIAHRVSRALSGRADRQAQQEIATLLSETDPARLNELANELRRQAARMRAGNRRAGRRTPGYGFGSGVATGNALGD